MPTLTAGEIINHARDLHPALSPANAPAVLAYRQISRHQQELIQEITVRQPAFLAEYAVVTLPLADFDAGEDLDTAIPSGWLDILEVFTRWSSSDVTGYPTRCQIVPWEQRDMPQPFPAVTIASNTLYLLGTAEGWARMASLRITYTAQPDDIVDDDSVLVVPVDAREALAHGLAAFWLGRLVGNPQYQVDADAVGYREGKAAEEQKKFLTRIWRTGQRQSYRVRDVT